MNKLRMTLEIWVHGTAGNLGVACEVDVLTVTGTNLPVDLLYQLINGGNQVSLLDDFGHLPTERASKVEVDFVFEDCDEMGSGWWAEILSSEILAQPEENS